MRGNGTERCRGDGWMLIDAAGVGCKATDIDVAPAAFKKLADMDLGRVTVTWAWLT